jgi:hypothetical protein
VAYPQKCDRTEKLPRPLHLLQKFVKGFSQLTTPLTDLTKKGAFSWTDEAHATFEKMKQVMSLCPVLALPDFTQPFVLECDAFRDRDRSRIDAKTTIPLLSRATNLGSMSDITRYTTRRCWPSCMHWPSSDSTWWGTCLR